MIIRVAGAVVGEVHTVRPHPHGTFIWLAVVDLGTNTPQQIVFGGDRKLAGGELVPVAPPGSRITIAPRRTGKQPKKMRVRSYRGEKSHGMLCSLDELGWLLGGPNEVALLCDVMPGQCLNDLPVDRRAGVVVGWDRARRFRSLCRKGIFLTSDMRATNSSVQDHKTVCHQV